ncbi:hypothetical protein N0V90_002383 [Kalmusia sp. IMI 367209]|nr:hypothetical protein N0V90_002383 [Kalmusia sp. IMI 367209]
MSNLIIQGNQPGVNFFEDSSGDDSEWEDDNGTRNFSETERPGSRGSGDVLSNNGIQEEEEEEGERGRQRHSEFMTALPPFDNRLPTHYSIATTATEEPSTPKRDPPNHARQLSLRRVSRIKVVDNHSSGSQGGNTPRDSILSNASSDILPRPLNVSRSLEDHAISGTPSSHNDHRTNTSESLRAGIVLEAHIRTMQALESMLPSSPPASRPSILDHTKQRSFSEGRHVKILPIQTQDLDPNRPPNLPEHFIKTPYPFSAKKEFPKPDKRLQRRDTDIPPFTNHDSTKGKHILGIAASDGDYDLRSRLERNKDAQGLLRSRSDATTSRPERLDSVRSTNGAGESIVYLSLRRNRRADSIADRLEQLAIPSGLVTTSPEPHARARNASHSPAKEYRNQEKAGIAVDFDDMFFALKLRAAYRNLAGPWALRALSARRLRCIRLNRISAWSGAKVRPEPSEGASGELLAARRGLASPSSTSSSPFTEHRLLSLYRRPKTGKARYTWVHWARRVAAANADAEREVTTVQFVHAFSPVKILVVLGHAGVAVGRLCFGFSWGRFMAKKYHALIMLSNIYIYSVETPVGFPPLLHHVLSFDFTASDLYEDS